MHLKRRCLVVLLSSAAALVGCALEGAPPAEHASSDNSVIAVQGTDGGNPVTGTRVLHYRLDIGDFTQPVDTASAPLQAFALQSDGGTQPLTIVPSSGAFSIPDAPPGEYYLQLGTFYVVTDARSVDLDRYQLGRSDAGTTPNPVSLNLSVTGLTPMDTYGPNLEMASSNLGAVGSLSGQAVVDAGTTSLTNYPVTYTEYTQATNRLGDPTKGDRFYINQIANRSNDLFSYTTYDRTFTPAAFAMNADAGTTLTGSFGPVRDESVTIAWWRSRFEAYQVQVHPQSTTLYQYIAISPTAWGNDSYYGYLGDLMYGSPSVQDIRDTTTTITYGNPYPYSWGEALTVAHYFRAPTRLPGTVSGGVTAGLLDVRPVSPGLGTIAPRVSPPWGLTIEGRDAQQDQTLTSLTPRLAWRAPLLGTPAAYRVRISRLYVSGTSTRTTSVASLHTSGTAVTVPPGVLQVSQKYAIVVSAYVTPGVDFARRPYVIEVLNDVASASASSSVLSTPASVPLPPSPIVAPQREHEEPGIRLTRGEQEVNLR